MFPKSNFHFSLLILFPETAIPEIPGVWILFSGIWRRWRCSHKTENPVKLYQFIQPACLLYRFWRNYLLISLFKYSNYNTFTMSVVILLVGVKLKLGISKKIPSTAFKCQQYRLSLLLFAERLKMFAQNIRKLKPAKSTKIPVKMTRPFICKEG